MIRPNYMIFTSALLALAAWGASSLPAQEHNAIYTSTRCITKIIADTGGNITAYTQGGELRRESDGSWQKMASSNAKPKSEKLAGEICSIDWQGHKYISTPEGLAVTDGKTSRPISMPPSIGSHISAMLDHAGALWVAMFGDGIWAFDGKGWAWVEIGLPNAAKEITAMAQSGDLLIIGTRREGMWEYDGKMWRQRIQPHEPYNANCQTSACFDGTAFFGTLEDGLIAHYPDGWKSYRSPEISSNAPREMVVFGGALYVRHGSGVVDRFDGSQWKTNVFSSLPRKQVSAIVTDGSRLFAAQWGGWSEFDGKNWIHHLSIPDLQGCPITALMPDGDNLWVGTQGRGLARIDRRTEKVTWHDERQGLPDDWVKHIAKCGRYVLAGTFVGGLAIFDGEKWSASPEIGPCEITGAAQNPRGGVLVATRKGVWSMGSGGKLVRLEHKLMPIEVEAQTVSADEVGIWVGCRNAVYRLVR